MKPTAPKNLFLYTNFMVKYNYSAMHPAFALLAQLSAAYAAKRFMIRVQERSSYNADQTRNRRPSA